MKKQLLLAFLAFALVIAMVACSNDPVEPGESTTDSVSESDTILEPDESETDPVEESNPDESETTPAESETTPAESETTPAESETTPVESETTPAESETTPAESETTPVESETDPEPDLGPVKWDVKKDVVTHQSFDELRINGESANGVFAPGASAGWDMVATLSAGQTSLHYWGWIGSAAETIGQFGYAVNDGEILYSADFAVTAGDDVVTAASGTGAKAASRMLINIDLANLTGENTVVVYYKSADDKVVILNEFTVVIEPDPNAEDTHNFTSNVAAQTDGAFIGDSDLANAFTFVTGSEAEKCIITNGAYVLDGFNNIQTKTNGKYAFSVDMVSTQDSYQGCFFIRGVQSATNNDNYYGSDGVRAVGGSGIYMSYTSDGTNYKLHLCVKSYNGAYMHNDFTPIISTNFDFTVVDTGDTIYILESGSLVAKIEVIGTKDYGIAGVAADALAEKVVITFADGSQSVVENACVAASHISDIGVISHVGRIAFSEISLMPASSVELPS